MVDGGHGIAAHAKSGRHIEGGRTVTWVLDLAGLCLLAIALFSVGWVGYLASDDAAYIEAARGWLEPGPYLPETHWAVRHTLTLPLALALWVFGDSEFVVTLPSTLYALAVLALVYCVVRHGHSRTAALVCALVLITTELYIELGTYTNVDIAEACFLFVAFASAAFLGQRTLTSWPAIILVGLAIGLAGLTRSTAVAGAAVFAVLFLSRQYGLRTGYPVAAGIAAIPFLAEGAYYTWLSGDPLHRLKTIFATHGTPDAGLGGQVGTGTGNVTHDVLFGPPAALLLNNEFGLLFWLAIPAAATLLIRQRPQTPGMRLFAGMAAGYVALMLVIVFYTLGLRPLPRYFAFATVLATVLVGLWLAEGLLRPRWRWAAAMALVTIVATNLILVDLSDLDPRFGARRLVDAMAAHPNEVIYTDPKLDQQARQLESWAGLDPDRSVPEPPEPGALFLAYGPTATKGYVQGREFDPQDFRTRPSWRQVRRYDREPTLLGSVLVGIVLERANTPLPGRVYQAGPSAILYRLPGSAGAPMRYQAAGRLPATIASMRATASADRTLRQLDVAAAGSRRTP